MSSNDSTLNLHYKLIEATAQQNFPKGALYVVATPIGNIADISFRSLHVLSLVDAIACEDTRNSSLLLSRYGLHKPLIAAHQHNEHEVAQKIISRLQAGERIALISDAGTPAVSDPGAIIVNAIRNAGLQICPMPGANAAVTSLSASGLIQDRFYFAGFLPSKTSQRETELQALISQESTLIFYEAPHRIIELTASLLGVFGGERKVVFAREVTKLFEEIHRCHLSEALAWLEEDAFRLKGEYVVLVEGAQNNQNKNEVEALRVLHILLKECSVKQAAQLAATITGQKKNTLYQIALELKRITEEE